MARPKVRTIRMNDELWEALAELAKRNGRTIAEEMRVAAESHLRVAGNVHVNDTRRVIAPHPSFRQI